MPFRASHCALQGASKNLCISILNDEIRDPRVEYLRKRTPGALLRAGKTGTA